MQPGHGQTHGVEFDAYMTEFSGTDASVGAIADFSLSTSELKSECKFYTARKHNFGILELTGNN